MTIMIVCGLLLAAGVAAGVFWGGREFAVPDLSVDLTPAEVARRYIWYVSIMLTAGIAAGTTVIGGGGRLAMRLLAVTAGDDAQGRLTEADEVVGNITVSGTVSFVLFNGIFGGVSAGAIYLVARRFLPSRRLGGLAFGLGLLVVFGSVIDPLRKENPDFDIVGPGWVSVLVFVAMAAAFGLAMAGFAARISQWLPLLARQGSTLVRYIVPGLLAAAAFSLTGFLMVLGALVVAVTRFRPLVAAVRSDRWVLAGRIALVALVVLSAPSAISNIADIAGR